MRKIKTVRIDDLEITVKELRVKDIRAIMDGFGGVEDDNVGQQIMQLLPLMTDLPVEKLDEMAPSEINTLWEAAREVNAFFLNTLEKIGLTAALRDSILTSLTESFASLSSPDTAPDASNTDLLSS